MKYNTSGCEVLLVDAEGADCAIVRSVFQACKRKKMGWPSVIRFETRGVAGMKGPCEEEEMIVQQLQEKGYLLVEAGGDATLLYASAVQSSPALANWADKWFPLECYSCGWWTYPSMLDFSGMVGHGYSQWRGAVKDRINDLTVLRPWCCFWCACDPQFRKRF